MMIVGNWLTENLARDLLRATTAQWAIKQEGNGGHVATAEYRKLEASPRSKTNQPSGYLILQTVFLKVQLPCIFMVSPGLKCITISSKLCCHSVPLRSPVGDQQEQAPMAFVLGMGLCDDRKIWSLCESETPQIWQGWLNDSNSKTFKLLALDYLDFCLGRTMGGEIFSSNEISHSCANWDSSIDFWLVAHPSLLPFKNEGGQLQSWHQCSERSPRWSIIVSTTVVQWFYPIQAPSGSLSEDKS